MGDKKIFKMINRIEKIKKILYNNWDECFQDFDNNDEWTDDNRRIIINNLLFWKIGIDEELKEQLNQLEKKLKEMVV